MSFSVVMLRYPNILVYVGCIYLAFQVVQGKNGCRDLLFIPCINNKNFTGHVISTFKILAPGYEDCQMKCFLDNRCISYNLSPVERQMRKCELNEFDHVTRPNDVIDQRGSDYCPLKNPCSSKPCNDDKICVPDFAWDRFYCWDGIWSQWGQWSMACFFPQTRKRKCRNPFTKASATDCPGPDQETKVPRNCAEVLKHGCKSSRVYTVNPDGGPNDKKIKVYCDQQTDGGGWTVIQKRKDGSVDFYRGWQDYKVGFGNLNGEFWLGLDKIYRLTHQIRNRLRVDLESDYAEYDYFAVSDEANNYTLSLGKYTGGPAKDSFSYHANYSFTTKDRDHDINPTRNCAHAFKGAWWYKDCHLCNLNGKYLNGQHSKFGVGIVWQTWKDFDYSAKTAGIKIRPI